MKPTEEELLEKNKNNWLHKIKEHNKRQKDVDAFNSFIKNQAIIWAKAADHSLVASDIKDVEIITDKDNIKINFRGFQAPIYMPLAILWNKALIEDKKKEVKEIHNRKMKNERYIRMATYIKLKKEFENCPEYLRQFADQRNV